MINDTDIEAFEESYGYWAGNYAENARLRCMTPASMVREFSAKTGQMPDPRLYSVLIREEFEEFRKEQMEGSREDQLKELSDLVYVIYGYANSRGWDLDEAIRRVHDNNVGRCVQEDGTVKRRADGKIIKNPDYPKVDLSDLV